MQSGTAPRFALGIVAIGASLGSAPPTYAQGEGVLEEIVVTAQRREESLLEVPVSITAFTAADLKKSNITEAKDYLALAPNVSYTQDGESGNRSINISIRGVSNVDLGEVSAANLIGFYVDELNVGTVANGTINPQLQDMERIEVLRGPQGTYFGRNSLGGALNITTHKPGPGHYGELTVSGGEFSTFGVEGMFNAALSDRLMIRGVGAYEESDGLVENVNPNGAPNSGYEYTTGRLALRYLATDNLTVDLSVTLTEEDEGHDAGIPSGVIDLDTQSIFGPTFVPIDDQLGLYPANEDRVNHNTPELNDNAFTIVNGRITWETDNYVFKSITGVIESESDRIFDQDNISADAIIRFNEYKGSSFSQEFRVASTGSEAFQWTAGLYYAMDEIEQFNSIQAGSEGSYTNPVTGEVIGLLPPIPAGFRINENNREFETRSLALFGEGTWRLSDAWSLTVGGRYTNDDVDNRSFGVVAFEGAVDDASGRDSFNDVSPRVVLRYAPSDALNVYGSVSKGYKAGGVDFNSGVVTSFDPEDLWSYEAGFKSRLADGRARFGAAVYYLDWQDLQVQTNFLADPNDISSAVEKTLNATSASSLGAELEFATLISDGLTLALNAGFIDAEFDDFPDAVLAGGNMVNLSGATLPNTPELTMSGVLDYTRATAGGGEFYGRLEVSYRDSIVGDLEGAGAPQLGLPSFPYQVDSFTVTNLRVGYDAERFAVNAFVENLFDEDYYTGTSDNFGLGGIRLRPNPLMFGASVTFRLGEAP